MGYMQRFKGKIIGAEIAGNFDGTIGATTPGAVTATTVSATTVTGTNVTATTLKVSASNNITAHAGGGQASAMALTTTINRVVTVGTTADSVKLPASAAGLKVLLVNGHASNSIQVFGAGTDTINEVATDTGVAQAAGVSALYFCPVAGKWFRILSA